MRRGHSVIRSVARALRLASPALSAVALAACLSAPPAVHLHSLMPSELGMQADAPARRPGTAPLVLVLDPIRLPAQVDQPQWLVQLPDGSLASLEQERWASPLRDELQQAVLETLIVRHGVVELRHAGGAAAAANALRVDIDVRRFESIPGQEARIEGSWTITGASPSSSSAPTPSHCEWFIRERASGAMSTLAASHRRAVTRLADGIGAAMAALKRGESVRCPESQAAG